MRHIARTATILSFAIVAALAPLAANTRACRSPRTESVTNIDAGR
jgi:hypothetical protein